MPHQDRVDILLAAYNGGNYISCQIDSVLNQMGSGCRLLIRDDESSDNTLSIVRQYASENSNIILLEDQDSRLGICGNYNRLLQNSNADYIAFCDQDDVWLPGHISKSLAAIKTMEWQSGVDTPVLAHTDLVVVDENLRTIAPSFWAYGNLNPLHGCRLNKLLVQNVVTGCATTINRALARLASPIPQQALMHDWWLAIIASALGRVQSIPDKTVLYRQHLKNKVGATSYNWQYVMHCACKVLFWGAANQCFQKTQRQAEAFLSRFAAILQSNHREAVGAYVNLKRAGYFARRMQLLKYGFLRTGLLRNLGWLTMI
jgi:glycosyltransferase involved in cell wall biosynthesis